MNASVALPGYGTCSVCALYSTDERRFAASASLGGGGSTGIGGSVGPQFFHSNAKSFSGMEGQDVFGGGSVGGGLQFSADYSHSLNNSSNSTITFGPQLGLEFSLPFIPAEGHGGSTNTWVYQW